MMFGMVKQVLLSTTRFPRKAKKFERCRCLPFFQIIFQCSYVCLYFREKTQMFFRSRDCNTFFISTIPAVGETRILLQFKSI